MPRALSTVSTMHYSITRPRARKQKAYINQKTRSNTFGVSLVLFIFFMATFVFYLYLNIQLVEANFGLKEMEKKLEEAEIENQNLEAQIGEALSIKKLQEVAQESKLEKAQDIRFVEIKTPGNLSMEK
mgnify:CR=1 FL=1